MVAVFNEGASITPSTTAARTWAIRWPKACWKMGSSPARGTTGDSASMTGPGAIIAGSKSAISMSACRATRSKSASRSEAVSGFRRVYPGGATTGPRPSGNQPFPASVGFIPAEPQLVRDRPATGCFRLPSGLSRRSHNWSATVRQPAVSGFRRVYPGGATTGPRPSGNQPFPASVGFIPAEPQLVRYRQTMTHQRSSPQRAITPARLRDPVKPQPVSASSGRRFTFGHPPRSAHIAAHLQ